MDHRVDHIAHDESIGPVLFILSWIFNLMTILDRGWITFILGTVLTILAGYYYILQISKLRREKKILNSENKREHDT